MFACIYVFVKAYKNQSQSAFISFTRTVDVLTTMNHLNIFVLFLLAGTATTQHPVQISDIENSLREVIMALTNFTTLNLKSSCKDAEKDKPACVHPFELAGNQCIYVAQLSHNWDDARKYCHKLNSDLVIIDSPRIFNELTTILHRIYPDPSYNFGLWIGGSEADGIEGNWRWVNGRKIKLRYPYWLPLPDVQPDNWEKREHHAEILFRNFWGINDNHGFKSRPHICGHRARKYVN